MRRSRAALWAMLLVFFAEQALAADCIFKWAYFSTKTLKDASSPQACDDLCLARLKDQFPTEWEDNLDYECYSIEQVSARGDKCLFKEVRSGREFGAKDLSKPSPATDCTTVCEAEASKTATEQFACYSLVARHSRR